MLVDHHIPPGKDRWRNSHVFVNHDRLLSDFLGVAPPSFTTVYIIDCYMFTAVISSRCPTEQEPLAQWRRSSPSCEDSIVFCPIIGSFRSKILSLANIFKSFLNNDNLWWTTFTCWKASDFEWPSTKFLNRTHNGISGIHPRLYIWYVVFFVVRLS